MRYPSMRPLAAVVAMCCVVAGCSKPADTSSEVGLTIDNCGFDVTIPSPPQRATTMEQGATDTLLLLGAKDRIAGYGHQKDAPPAGYDLDGIEEISDTVPNTEQLRDADTDFILTPFSLSWEPSQAGPREEWKRLGVATYQTNTECRDYGDNKGKSVFDLLEKDITELGQIFGLEENAQKLVDKQHASLDNATKAPEGTTFVLLYSSVGGAPYVAGGPSIVTEFGERTGMVNAFANIDEEWPQVSWEAIAEADPDVIILGDLPERGEPGDTWQEKAETLTSTPGTREMKAVRNGRFIVLPGVTVSASARSYEAIDAISEALDQGVLERTEK